jgi:hypothetical protein
MEAIGMVTPKVVRRGQTKCWAYFCDGAPTHVGWYQGSDHPTARPVKIAVCARHAGIRVGYVPKGVK